MGTTDSIAIATHVVTTGDESSRSPTATRLDSWKDIAHYLNRSVRTVQRWELLEAMPVHRHCHDTGGSVYGYKQEVDAWRLSRSQEKQPTLQVSAIRRVPMASLARAEQSALLRLLGVIVEYLHEEAARSTVAPPVDDAFGQCAAKEGLVVAEGLSGPSPAERMTIGDTIGTPLLVACRKLQVDQ
jgi:hypothetical protein